MGLDQYAYSKHKGDKESTFTEKFYWRKHSKLQLFMEKLYFNKIQKEAFNCKPLELTQEDVDELREMIKNNELPKCSGGFFWGAEFGDEAAADYKEQDLEFCDWAENELKEDRIPIYYSWW
jgi:hypothetical protein